MAFFFSGYSATTLLTWVALVLGLIIANEISRRYKSAGIFVFCILPVLLTVWWIIALQKDLVPSLTSSFAWIKTYSALAGCIGFMIIRYGKSDFAKSKYLLIFPAFILAFNILEAVFYDFYNYARYLPYAESGFFDAEKGLTYFSGPWNILNGIAGIINIVTLSGWFGIKISKKKSKDMVWADQLWFWIIAYDVWNIAYCYNNISERAMYAGMALIVACTFAEFFIQKGSWLQHRAYTLAIFAMFSLSVPYSTYAGFQIHTSQNKTALLVLSLLAFIINVAVGIYALYRIFKYKKNPLKDELYSDLKAYDKIVKFNKLDTE